jgi:hypothetical protein
MRINCSWAKFIWIHRIPLQHLRKERIITWPLTFSEFFQIISQQCDVTSEGGRNKHSGWIDSDFAAILEWDVAAIVWKFSCHFVHAASALFNSRGLTLKTRLFARNVGKKTTPSCRRSQRRHHDKAVEMRSSPAIRHREQLRRTPGQKQR